MSIHEIIAALLLPVPIFHLWLHAMLPFWRKHPMLYYALWFAVWVLIFTQVRTLYTIAPQVFNPSQAIVMLGWILMIFGAASMLSSLITLGPKRFFVWAVLRPQSVQKMRITKGPFRFIPHPGYIGYILIALGNFLSDGKLALLAVLFYLLSFTPIVMYLEEEELKARTS